MEKDIKLFRDKIQEIYAARYYEEITVDEIEISKPSDTVLDIGLVDTCDFFSFKKGDTFIGRDQYYWLKIKVQWPLNYMHKAIRCFFDIGKTGVWFEKGMEGLLYLKDGTVCQGVDRNHQEVILENFDIANNVFYILTWSGVEAGGEEKEQEHTFKKISFALYRPDYNALYYHLKHILDEYERLDADNTYKYVYQKILKQALSIYTNENVDNSLDYIKEQLSKYNKNNLIESYCVAHSHLDLAWLWRIRHSKQKAKRTFNTVYKMMQEHDGFVFFQSQPQIYQWIKETEPGLYEAIQDRVKQGRWEVGGGLWVECDMNMPNGESLVRQLLYGEKFFREEFGEQYKKDFIWLPDVFGFNFALPQLMRSANIDCIMTTKLSWNEYNKMPEDTFLWKGMDASQVLCHLITTPHPYGEKHYVYNAVIDSNSLLGTWENYQSKQMNPSMLIAYGYGDGGGGANMEMVNSIDIVDQIPTLPKVKHSSIREYIQKLTANFNAYEGMKPIWNNELYLEFHRGTYTTQGKIKKWNRKLESIYRYTEMVAATASLFCKDWNVYPFEQIEQGIKILLTNQFHDILPGSCTRQVAEDALGDYQQSASMADEIITHMLRRISVDVQDMLTVYNPIMDRENIMLLNDVFIDASIIDEHQNVLLSQLTREGTWIYAKDLTPFAFNNYKVVSGQRPHLNTAQVDIHGRHFENNLYIIQWSPRGSLTRIYSKQLDRELILEGSYANEFQVFDDKPGEFEAWEIKLETLEDTFHTMEVIKELESVTVLEKGDLFTSIEFRYRYKNSTVLQTMKIYNDSNRIDFETHMNWQTQEKLVKVKFPLNIYAREATHDVSFGNIKRPTHRTTSWDKAKFETCAIRYVDLSQRDFGISLLNDGKYGYDVEDGCVRLSLIKSSIHPDVKADIGEQSFIYSLYPHRGDFVEGRVNSEARKLNNKLVPYFGKKSQVCQSLVEIDGKNVEVDAIKRSQDGEFLILRLHEYGGGSEKIKISSSFGISRYAFSNILEEEDKWHIATKDIICELSPYEIKTLKMEMKK